MHYCLSFAICDSSGSGFLGRCGCCFGEKAEESSGFLRHLRHLQPTVFCTPTSHTGSAMDVDEFDDILIYWQNHFDALSDATIEFPVGQSTAEIFLDDFPEIKEDITVVTCAGSDPVNIVLSLPSLTTPANFVPSPIWSGSGLQVIPPTCDVVVQPRSINSSRGRFTTCMSKSELWGQRGSCVTEETPPSAQRKKKISAARVSRKKIKTCVSQKNMKQFPSKESTRLPTPEEHILRERKRRDDMAEKFLLLETILPPEARRQKSVIVEDAIKLVKILQLRKEELLKRRAQMKLMLLNRNKSESSPQYPRCQSKRFSSYEKSAGDMASMKLQRMQVTPSSILDRRKPIDTDVPIIMWHSPNNPIAGSTVENMTPLKIDTNKCRELLQIHSQVSDDEILVEMLFHKYSTNLYTRVIRTVETMKLEVIRGSMQRSVPCGFVDCIITAKPRVECQSRRQDTLSSARVLVGALQAAFRNV